MLKYSSFKVINPAYVFHELSSIVLSEGKHDVIRTRLNLVTLTICFDISDASEGALERGLRSLYEAIATTIQVGS